MKPTTRHVSADSRAVTRDALRRQRRNLSARQRAAKDSAIRDHLLSLIRSREARSLAAYWSFDGEPDLEPLCEQLINEGREVGLPVVSGEDGNMMAFHAWHAETTLAPNQYGIMEPAGTVSLALGDFDMLVIPLVGYDRTGNRIGMGAGYYDRHLEGLRETPAPLRVGVAYELQELRSIEQNAWDVPLHCLINETGWIQFEQT
jgi:5-formyltetrahydrofolate cyclo-ligase